MKKLIVISNHTTEKWCEEQRRGWEEIYHIPFPNVSAEADTAEVMSIARELIKKINSLTDEGFNYISCQGEFSLATVINNWVYQLLTTDRAPLVMVFPTTERNAVETVEADGTTSKQVVFKFCQWREI